MPGRRRRHLYWLTTNGLASAAAAARLGAAAAAAGRGMLRPVPPARRDWAEAIWAEAHEVPAGSAAGLAGGRCAADSEGGADGTQDRHPTAGRGGCGGWQPGEPGRTPRSASAMAPRTKAMSSSR